MTRRWLFWLAGLGAVLFVRGFILTPGYACTDLGYSGDPAEKPEGFGFEGIENGAIAWTPDGGINTCHIGFGILTTPLGALLVLFSLVATYRT